MKSLRVNGLQLLDGELLIMVKMSRCIIVAIAMIVRIVGGKESTVQRQAVLPIWRNEDCNDAYFQPITSNFICAGYAQGGTDACQVTNDSFQLLESRL